MFVARVRALTIRPRVQRKRKQLLAKTPWLLAILSLGGYARTVHVDGDARYVYLHVRRFWFFVRTRVIPFKQIQRVRYEHFALPTSFDRRGKIHDQFEGFHVTLILNESDERVHLVSFYGAGSAGDLETLVLGDSLVDCTGTQELDSREFVEQLCALTGASLTGPSTQVTDAQGRQWHCSGCGRAVALRPRCLYCGGEVSPRR